MNIRCGHEFLFEMPAPAPILLMFYTHPSRSKDLMFSECLQVEPFVPVQTHLDLYGNRCARIAAPAGSLRIFNGFTISDTGNPDPVHPGAQQNNVCDMPHAAF